MTSDSKAEPTKFEIGNYVLKLTFAVHAEEHDGYCSDPDEIKTSDRTVMAFHAVPESLNDRDLFDAHLRLKKDKLPLLKEFNTESLHGNGYCGCKKTKRVTSAKLLRKPFLKTGASWGT